MRKAISIALAAVLLCIAAGDAFADLTATIQPQSTVLNVGSTSYFDVLLSGTSATGDPLAGYTITTLDNAGITYTGVSNQTTSPITYVFPGSSPMQQSAPPDMQYIDTGSNTINLGETFSAGRVFFTAVQPGVFSLDFDPNRSGFFTSTLADITTTYIGSSVTIIPANVPEPSTTLLLGLTGVVGFGVSRFRKRRALATTAA